MSANVTQQEALLKTIDGLKRELEGIPETDSAARDKIQKKLKAAEQHLEDIQQESPDLKTPIRPDKQFFSVRECVEMVLVGGGGALGGLIAFLFKEAQIWEFVPKNARVIHCMGAGALAAGLAVWFIARTDRNKRVPCFLFSILCGLAGLQMIEKAASTILPNVIPFHVPTLASADNNIKAANETAKKLQESSTPDNVKDAKTNIQKVGDSIQDLTKARGKAADHGDTSALTVIDKSLGEATQSLAKIKFESQSIPEVSKKAEEVLNTTVPPDVAKSAEQKELEALKEKYLKITANTGWCFLGSYDGSKWERQTTNYTGTLESLKVGQVLTVTNAVYLRSSPPGENYKLGEVINAFFEGDVIRVIEIKPIEHTGGLRVWANVKLGKRAGNQDLSTAPESDQPNAAASPTATQTATGAMPQASPAARHPSRKHSR